MAKLFWTSLRAGRYISVASGAREDIKAKIIMSLNLENMLDCSFIYDPDQSLSVILSLFA
ncbi:hypothetical protein [Campylobacter hyointestinalis]|uniref:hypothetical protein n=1 Tax=Campylobacter hyointestinalis TaxID=198 RepID=UPI000A78F9B6|nr:hypothetical protein [Campylobacter hyointestinalis]